VRLFIGVEISDEMKEAAASVSERLQTALKRAGLHVAARWVPAANLHVTLWFIGEVDDARAASISGALSRPFNVPPFTLRVGGLGAFPPSGNSRVFWIGITQGNESLAALHAELAVRLAPLGFEPERRAFSAHLTIARVKDVTRGASTHIRRLLADMSADVGSMTVSTATLFRSRVSSKGSTYEALMRIPLA
jgi:RNA 2',3'-cyclic 3'-phosphodiesterase